MKALTPNAPRWLPSWVPTPARTEVVSKLWAYIKKNKPQDAVNKRMINDDAQAKEIRRCQSPMFEILADCVIGKHLKFEFAQKAAGATSLFAADTPGDRLCRGYPLGRNTGLSCPSKRIWIVVAIPHHFIETVFFFPWLFHTLALSRALAWSFHLHRNDFTGVLSYRDWFRDPIETLAGEQGIDPVRHAVIERIWTGSTGTNCNMASILAKVLHGIWANLAIT